MDFKTLDITTNTYMVYFNCYFDMENLKNLKINVTENMKDPKDKVEGELYIEKSDTGSADRMRNQKHVRIFAVDKIVATKIIRTGKLHFTGIKRKEHAYRAAVSLAKKFKEIDAIKNIEGDNLTITFETVMVNVGFELDFTVDREKLDDIELWEPHVEPIEEKDYLKL